MNSQQPMQKETVEQKTTKIEKKPKTPKVAKAPKVEKKPKRKKTVVDKKAISNAFSEKINVAIPIIDESKEICSKKTGEVGGRKMQTPFDNTYDPALADVYETMTRERVKTRPPYTPQMVNCITCGQPFDFNKAYPAVIDIKSTKCLCEKCRAR